MNVRGRPAARAMRTAAARYADADGDQALFILFSTDAFFGRRTRQCPVTEVVRILWSVGRSAATPSAGASASKRSCVLVGGPGRLRASTPIP